MSAADLVTALTIGLLISLFFYLQDKAVRLKAQRDDARHRADRWEQAYDEEVQHNADSAWQHRMDLVLDFYDVTEPTAEDIEHHQRRVEEARLARIERMEADQIALIGRLTPEDRQQIDAATFATAQRIIDYPAVTLGRLGVPDDDSDHTDTVDLTKELG